jgi:hypothetical protein
MSNKNFNEKFYINKIAVAGRVSKIWDNESNAFIIKSGETEKGLKWHSFDISVYRYDNNSKTFENGKGLRVVLYGDIEIKDKDILGVWGKLQPSNWTNPKDGKITRGHKIVAFSEHLFTPDEYEPDN